MKFTTITTSLSLLATTAHALPDPNSNNINSNAAKRAANPEFVIAPTTTKRIKTYATDQAAQATRDLARASSANAAWIATKTVDPVYQSQESVFKAALATISGVPEAVTATDTVVVYKTVPAWYTAVPEGARKYMEELAVEQEKVVEKAVLEGGAVGYASRAAGVMALAVAVGVGALVF